MKKFFFIKYHSRILFYRNMSIFSFVGPLHFEIVTLTHLFFQTSPVMDFFRYAKSKIFSFEFWRGIFFWDVWCWILVSYFKKKFFSCQKCPKFTSRQNQFLSIPMQSNQKDFFQNLIRKHFFILDGLPPTHLREQLMFIFS